MKSKESLDVMFSKFIRARDKSCQVCGTTNELECAHIFSRAALSGRWNPDNAIALCHRCHMHAHSQPRLFQGWLRDNHPLKFKAANIVRNTLTYSNSIDYAEIYKNLKEMFDNLEKNS